MSDYQVIGIVIGALISVCLAAGLLLWQMFISQLRFQAICENSGNMIVVGKAITGKGGKITDIELVGCNEVYARHLDSSVEDITGRRIVRDFFDGDEPDWLDVVRESISTHESRHLEFTYDPLGTRYSGSVLCLSPIRKRCCFIMDEISDAYKRKSELLKVRNLMDSVLEMSGVGMWQWHLKSNTITVLKAIFKLAVPHDRQELSLRELLLIIHPDDRKAVLSMKATLPEKGKASSPVEFRMDDRMGGWHWFQAVAVKTGENAEGKPDSLVGVVFDVDSLKRSQLKVEQISKEFEINQKWLMYSLQQSRTGYCRWDVKTDKLYHSDNFWLSVGGMTPEEEARQNIPDTMTEFKDLIVAEDPERLMRMIESVYSGYPEEFSFRCHFSFLPDKLLEVRTSVLERDDEGKAKVMSTFIIDITEMLHHEEVLRAAVKEADEANRSKGRFLAMMSHEIRTPLNAIIGFSSILKGADISGQLQSYADSIKSSGEMLMGLINDLLDLAKIESAMMELRLEPVSIPQLLTELKGMFALKIKAKQLYFNLNCDQNLPMFNLDGKRVQQVLVNLTGNAVKFTSQGGITLTVVAEPCENSVVYPGIPILYRLIISVRDTGEGISKEDFERVFNPFAQGVNNQNSFVEGTGLGLAICKNLIELMGGTITLESELGSGSNFTVILERVEPSGITAATPAIDEALAAAPINPEIVDVFEEIPPHVFDAIFARFGPQFVQMQNGMHVQSAHRLVSEMNQWVNDNNAYQVKDLLDALRQAVDDFNVTEVKRIVRVFVGQRGGNE